MKKLLIILGFLLLTLLLILTSVASKSSLDFIAVKMLWLLVLFWVVICGLLFYFSRDLFSKFYSKIPWAFPLKFTVFSTIFMLIEEAIAVSINNSYLSETGGRAILVVSTDYWELVSKHSVVVFIPIFFIFGLFIKKFKISQNKSFIYFGIIGTLAEFSIGGLLSLIQFPLWVFVYGLMVYLPSYQHKL